jgi:hypothetical protein
MAKFFWDMLAFLFLLAFAAGIMSGAWAAWLGG